MSLSGRTSLKAFPNRTSPDSKDTSPTTERSLPTSTLSLTEKLPGTITSPERNSDNRTWSPPALKKLSSPGEYMYGPDRSDDIFQRETPLDLRVIDGLDEVESTMIRPRKVIPPSRSITTHPSVLKVRYSKRTKKATNIMRILWRTDV